MRRATRTRLFCLLVLLVPSTVHAQVSSASPVAFTHVTVVDVRAGALQPDMTVLVAGRRIAALGRTRALSVPPAARIVDATGKFLIPGLWDMHVHALVDSRLATFFPLFLANGVTGVRNMGSPMPLARIAALRAESDEGQILAPRIVASGPIVDGPRSGVAAPVIVTTATEARHTVDSLHRSGADFVKVYNNLSHDAFLAIAGEANALALPIAGHLPFAVSPLEAARAGQKSVEHMGSPSGGLLLACSTDEAAIRRRWVDAVTDTTIMREDVVRLLAATIPQILDSYNRTKAEQLARELARRRTWQTPTFVLLQRFAALADTAERDDSTQRYLPRAERERGDPRTVSAIRRLPREIARGYARLYPKQVELAGIMRRAGVEFLAGTDTPIMLLVPGFSLHDELEAFVAAGFSPVDALRAATLGPARYLGRERDLGTVAQGKLADLVLLDGDPLADIRHARLISAVVVNGRYISRDDLQHMLQGVEAAAGGR